MVKFEKRFAGSYVHTLTNDKNINVLSMAQHTSTVDIRNGMKWVVTVEDDDNGDLFGEYKTMADAKAYASILAINIEDGFKQGVGYLEGL